MKKAKGFSAAAVVASVLCVAVLVLLTGLVIKRNNEAVDFAAYAGTDVIEETEDNGGIADHVRGNAEAPVVIQEYANFQCSHCAVMHPLVEQAVAESNGQLAVVFRNFVWSDFPNSKAAAAAAEAAGLQGYWEAYADKLFTEQAEWGYADGTERTELFEKYFEEVAEGKGDMTKFREDVASDAVAQKITFDSGLAERAGATGTPAFFIDGQKIELTGGDLELKGGTLHYEGVSENEDFLKLLKDIVAMESGGEVKSEASGGEAGGGAEAGGGEAEAEAGGGENGEASGGGENGGGEAGAEAGGGENGGGEN